MTLNETALWWKKNISTVAASGVGIGLTKSHEGTAGNHAVLHHGKESAPQGHSFVTTGRCTLKVSAQQTLNSNIVKLNYIGV